MEKEAHGILLAGDFVEVGGVESLGGVALFDKAVEELIDGIL